MMNTVKADTITADELVYECPHCGVKVEVHESQLDEVIDCPSPTCGRPFEVPAPKAKLARKPSGEYAPGEVLEAGGPADVEHDVLVRHPAMFRNQPLYYSGIVAVFAAGVAGLILGWPTGVSIVTVLGGVAVAAAAGFFGVWWIQVQYQTLTVTNKRSIFRHGIIARRTNEVQHDDVRNIQVDQNIAQRLFGVGRVAISSSGQDDMEIDVRGIPDPAGVAETIRTYQ